MNFSSFNCFKFNDSIELTQLNIFLSVQLRENKIICDYEKTWTTKQFSF